MADVVKQAVAGSKGSGHGFAKEIWGAMGCNRLLDPDAVAGGGQESCQRLTRTARALAEHGQDLGVTLSWIIHHLTAGVLTKTGPSDSSRRALMETLSSGGATLSLAVSEPGGGGHPKYLTTRADRDKAGWVISGDKAYLTNGPVAAAFLVVAITGESAGKKVFSTFLVDQDTPGLTLGPAMTLPFLTSAPHGGIRLDRCRVKHGAMVGLEGRAYPDLVLPLRQREDAVMTGAVTGAMTALLTGAAAGLPGSRKEEGACLEALGRLAALSHAAVALSDHLAALVDGQQPGHDEIHLVFRDLASGFVRDLDAFCRRETISLSCPELLRDLKASAKLGETVSGIRTRKLGKRLADSV